MLGLLLFAALSVHGAVDWGAIPLQPVSGGGVSSLADYRGRFVLLNFWATWCLPCRYEMPALDRLQQEFAGRGVAVIGVTAEIDADRVRQFVTKMGARYPVFLDPQARLYGAARPEVMPTSILLDREGAPLKRYSGFDRRAGLAEIESDLSDYLQR